MGKTSGKTFYSIPFGLWDLLDKAKQKEYYANTEVIMGVEAAKAFLRNLVPPSRAERDVLVIESLPEWAQKEFQAKDERIKMLQGLVTRYQSLIKQLEGSQNKELQRLLKKAQKAVAITS